MSVSPLADETGRGRLRAIRTWGTRILERMRRIRVLDVAWAGLALVLALVCGWLLVGRNVALWSVGGGIALGLVTYAFTSDHPLVRASGGVFLFPAGLLSIVGVLVAATVGTASPIRGLVVWVTVAAIGLIGFAAVVGPAEVPSARFGRAVRRAWFALLGGVALLALLILPDLALVGQLVGVGRSLGATLLAHLLGTQPAFATIVFPALVTVAAWTLRRALRGLPFDMLVPADSREQVATGLDHAERALTVVLGIGIVSLVALPVASMSAGSLTVSSLRTVLPASLVTPVLILLRSTALRLMLLGTVVIAGGAYVGYRTLIRARRIPLESVARALVPPVGSALTVAFAGQWLTADVVLSSVMDATARTLGVGAARLLARVDPFVLGVAGALVVSAIGVWLLTVLSPTVRFFLPARATGGALAAAAAFTLAIVLTLVGRTFVGLGVGALAIGIWDAGAHVHVLKAELGVARTRRAELVHFGGVLAIGLFAVLSALGVAWVLTGITVAGSVSSLLALVFAALGASLLLYSLK